MALRQRTREVAGVEGGDAQLEEYLDSKGVQWLFHPKVSVEEFDADKSLHNQVRFQPVDPKVVDEYAEAMRRGDVFPPVIVTKAKTGFINADGNHRLQAAIKAHKPLRVYELLDAPATLVTLIAFERNTKHGQPTSEAERIQHALYLMEQGATVPSAAAAVNLPRKVVEKASQKRSTDARFIENNIPPITVEKLAETVKWRLSQITTDEGFAAAVELALAANLSSDQVFDLVTRVNSIRSSNGQVQMIKDVRADMLGTIQDAGGGVFVSQGKRVMGPRTRVGLALTNVLSLPEDLDLLQKQWVGADREDAAKKMRQAAKRLNELARALAS